MRVGGRQRREAVRHCQVLIDHGPKSIGYLFGGGDSDGWMQQSIPGMVKRFAAGRVWEPDCEHTINWVARWSGWRAPGGAFGWDASSGEMWQSLPHFENVRDAHDGALVVYGEGGDDHVAMIIGDAGSENPVLFSHGSAFSTNRVSFQAETEYHASLGQPMTLLSVAGL